MADHRTHLARTSDGVALAGTVHGQGPPLVFWHGAYGDGDLDWQALLPHLTDRFTCHLPSWRGRGLSEDHPDLGYGRRVHDVLAYVDSLAEPTGLVGWSGGASPALAAAARTASVAAVALYEPTVGVVMNDQERAALGGAVARMGELAREGKPVDALLAAAGYPFSDEEIATVEEAGYVTAAARYVPNLLGVFQQLATWDGPTADDPAVLGAVSAPVLVLRGAVTKPFWVRGAQYLVDHLPQARVDVVPGAGHAGPLTHRAAVAGALGAFFGSTGPRT